MALASSGTLSIGGSTTDRSINLELGRSATATSSLGETDLRTLAGVSSGAIAISDFYGASNATDISTTNFARINSSLNSTYVNREQTSGIVFLTVTTDIRLRRQDNFVYYEVREGESANSSQWFNTSGTSNTLSTTYVTLGRFDLGGITAIKMNWSLTTSPSGSSGSIIGNTSSTGATFSASDNSFQTVSNGQSIGALLTATASAECFATETATAVATIDITARKSGYNDTTLGTYRHESRARAVSNNCF